MADTDELGVLGVLGELVRWRECGGKYFLLDVGLGEVDPTNDGSDDIGVLVGEIEEEVVLVSADLSLDGDAAVEAVFLEVGSELGREVVGLEDSHFVGHPVVSLERNLR